MDFIIRKGGEEDMPSVLSLITELAIFENEPDAVKITVKDLTENGFKEHPAFRTFVAEVAGNIVGMALFYNRFSTWEGKSIHLEDLVVKKEFRGTGIGKALYTKVLEYAYKNNANRAEWVVLDWNKVAADFYVGTGAKMLEDWNLCQMNRSTMQKYLEQNESI